MAASKDINGILFIFESDTYEWAAHLSSLLVNEYNIPCMLEHWWNLNEQIAASNPVHVLLLSPLMEPQVTQSQFSFLRNDSESSLLLECNADLDDVSMPPWARTKRLELSLEVQRDIITTLVEMYEMETNDDLSSISEELINMDIVPTHLYPGERTVHILFSIDPQCEVTLRLEGVPKRLPTKKYTQHTYTCDLPAEIGAGQKIISVYTEGISNSVYSTRIVIVTPEKLLENYIENLQLTCGKRYRSSTWVSMGLCFNPFADYYCPQYTQLHYAQRIQAICKYHIQGQRDSGFSAYEENEYETIHPIDEESSDGSASWPIKAERKSKSLSSFIKRVFSGNSKVPERSQPRRKKPSRRVVKARSASVHQVPALPGTRL